jgi:hypothetical protein
MKLRILNYRMPATHSSITPLADFSDAVSISDFDAFTIDPNGFAGTTPASADYFRRINELNDLVHLKSGIVICVLRPNDMIGVSGMGAATKNRLLEAIAPKAQQLLQNSIRAGEGSQIKLNPVAKGALGGYFRVLQENLRFSAYFATGEANITGADGTVFAVDSVAYPIAVEFRAGGRLCYVPAPHGVPSDRVGSAIVRVVEAHFGGPSEIESPAWSAEVVVPGATAHDSKIGELGSRKKQIEAEMDELVHKRTALLNYRALLYGYGKSILEPVVRSAFRLVGFDVPEPDKYSGEWDVELHEPKSLATAIGEVEGSEGAVDVDKYRQLLDYIQAEALEDRDHKGILVGNGFRLTEPGAPERQNQFTEHALRGARKNSFCLLPTSELFKAVCAVLEAANGDGLKIKIRDSILATVGVWTFAREPVVPTDSIPSLAAPSAG